MTTLAAVLLTLVAGVSSGQTLAKPGILLLAHGGQPDWNARVLDLVAAVDAGHPTEVAFGMAFRPSIQSAVDRLIARGVSEIVAVPLFVSSHSSLVTSTAYLLGLRHEMPSDLKIFATMNHGASAGSHQDHGAQAGRAEDNTRAIVSRVPIRMTPALDRHRVVTDILTTRARAISIAPDREAVVLVAHGPVPDEDNRLWLADMAVLAAGVQAAAPFRSVDFLTVRDDAPPAIRDEAAAALRALVERRAQEGRRVLVVPLLLSFGGIEQGVRKRLAGLDYVMADQGLMPDARLKQWVLAVATGEGLAPSAVAGVGDRVASRESLRSWGSGLRPSWESESASSVSSAAPFDSVLRRVAQGGLGVSAPSAALVQSASQSVSQTQEDDYTRYELLAPDTARFRILYEVTATTPGAPFFFNAIRKGSIASDERVIDPMTGQPLKWEVVSGRQARAEGHPTADLETEWLKVYLARPVPQGGEARVLIDKTYMDARSYYRDGDTIVFDRSLGIRRNAVVLPAGYRLISCNVPSQVLTTPDGRVMISFMNPGPSAAPLVIKAKLGLPAARSTDPSSSKAADGLRDPLVPAQGPAARTAAAALPSQSSRLSERAHQDREIVYFPDDPSTHAFSLYHDYTESRPGVGHYFNVVRSGSTVSNPSAVLLDTGEKLKVETLKGDELKKRGLDAGEPVMPDTSIVVITFPPVMQGHTVRLRISETYTDPGRYYLDGDELVWDRAFGRPRNTVVLPSGWTVVASSIPGVISEDPTGRQRLYFENNRPDEIQVLIRARRQR